jgi:hypothetical protein
MSFDAPQPKPLGLQEEQGTFTSFVLSCLNTGQPFGQIRVINKKPNQKQPFQGKSFKYYIGCLTNPFTVEKDLSSHSVLKGGESKTRNPFFRIKILN